MAKKVYELTAKVSTENPKAIRRVLEGLIENGSVSPVDDLPVLISSLRLEF